MSPKKSRRVKSKFSALKKEYTLKTRLELLDYDYVDKLSDKDKQWLANFTDEYLHVNFNHSGKKFYKSKTKKREIYNQNNSRNRDIFAREMAQNKLEYLGTHSGKSTEETPDNIEDALIYQIDNKEEIEKATVPVLFKEINNFQKTFHTTNYRKNSSKNKKK